MTKTALVSVVVLLLSGAKLVQAQKFYSDDPIAVEEDKLDTPIKPSAIELSDMYDRLGHMFHDFGASNVGSEAENVNTLDEVPDSSWFTNRHGSRRLSLDELKRGSNSGQGPSPHDTWLVFKGKSQGLTPGFEITDEKGERYVIKMDPVGIPELSSSAEVIATKIFYAIGYNVPENYIIRYDPQKFQIKPGTMVEDAFGDEAPLTDSRFRRMIRKVPPFPDGTLRLTASKYIEGQPLGPFRYYETRSDDPNDIIRHENRRELRGLRLFAAWTNHDDTRAQNTQDSWVERNGVRFVRHYLMDFGSTFGSGSVDMQYANLGFHYAIDLGVAKKNLVGFGLHVPNYRHAKWPDFPEYQAVGRWEGELFDPETWRNDYPNPAFQRMTARDAFWAAKILMTFTREELAAIVATGEYSDPVHAAYFLEVLADRQRKSGRFGINAINPLDEFRLEGRALAFTNLSEKYGFVEAGTRYRVSWSSYDNDNDLHKPVSEAVELRSDLRLEIPDAAGSRLLLVAEIHSINSENPHWNTAVHVYLRPSASGYDIVGIERERPEKHTFPMD